MVKKTKILIVDDHAIIREGLISLFKPQPDFEVVGEVGTMREAITKAIELRPDLVLMDISLPDGSGVEATRAILAQRPETKIVMLTVHESDELLFDAIRSGAKGYVLKNTPVTNLIASLRALDKGEAAISRAMAGSLVEEFSRMGKLTSHGGEDLENLTQRELDVLELLSTGATNRQIADRLVISENTVKNHVSSILKKLNLRNRREVAKFARRALLSDLDKPDNSD